MQNRQCSCTMNFKRFLVKTAIVLAVVFLTRALFQFPVEYLKLELFRQSEATRAFSKMDALKVISIVAVFFALYYRKEIAKLSHPKISWKRSVALLLSAQALVALYYGFRALSNIHGLWEGWTVWISWAIVAALLASALALVALAVYQTEYVARFWKRFRMPLLGAALASVISYALLMFFQGQWRLLSNGVTHILYKILSAFYPVLLYRPRSAPVLQIEDFAVAIGAPCSGIDSLLLFTAFFAGIFALDRRRILKGRFLVLFIIGIIGVYAVNILRLLILILVGVHISPRLAVGIFHTNAGWLFFVVYFVCYYWVIKRFIYKSGSTGAK